MTEKRFKEIIITLKVIDTQTSKEYDCLLDNDFYDLVNEIAEENERLKKERNHFERKKTEYLTEWNACRIKNTELRKDNLQAFALLVDIRALARTSDIETIIKKINKFEKEVVK